MKTRLLIAWTCPDRPGIVEQVAEVVAEYSGNWEESRLARLGGDFAGIALVSVPQERTDNVVESLRALAGDQMTVTVKTVRPGPEAAGGRPLYEIRLKGADHEGIVHRVSGYLAERGVNVEAMDTEVVSAPITGSPLFQMEARITAPPDVTHEDLTENLKRIGEELGVDIQVSPTDA